MDEKKRKEDDWIDEISYSIGEQVEKGDNPEDSGKEKTHDDIDIKEEKKGEDLKEEKKEESNTEKGQQEVPVIAKEEEVPSINLDDMKLS